MGPTFTAARANELARTDAALAAILGEYDRPHGAMSLGRRLAEATDVVIDGRALVRRGADRGVAVYGVRACGHQVREVLIDKMRTS
jgi:hypothetical protein